MRLLIAFLLLLFSLSFAKIKITTTIKPLADIVKEICIDNCEVNYVIPVNMSIHSYEYKYSDLKKIYSSDFFVFIGSGEPQIKKIISNIKEEKLIPVYKIKGINLIKSYEFEEHHIDKHQHDEDETFHPAVWLDPENAKIIASFITFKLIEKDNFNKSIYLENYRIFKEKIDSLLSYGKEKFSKLNSKDFISYHYLYPYFTKRFSLNYLAVIELGHGKKPTIKHLNRIIHLINEKDISSVFASKQFYNEKYLRIIKENTKAKVIKLDPFGENKSYIQMMRTLIDKIYKGLSR